MGRLHAPSLPDDAHPRTARRALGLRALRAGWDAVTAERPQDGAAAMQMLRQAIDPERLRRVLRLAGADEVAGEAVHALREAAADAVGRRLGLGEEALARPVPAGADANTLEEARAATRRAYLELAVHLAQAGAPADAVQRALALEIAGIAGHAVRYARAEGRAVDPVCVAVAAGRSADDWVPVFVPGV